jgi:cytochrome c oxidase assembly protein subunit 11
MEKVQERIIRVQFNADVPSSMQWHFKPLQHEIYVHPGETALAFYTGKLLAMVFRLFLSFFSKESDR